MIWIVLACIFGVFMGKVIRDEGLGWGSAIVGGAFCGFVGWFLAFVLTGAAISGISKATNSVKYIPDPAESHNLVALQDNIYTTCFRNADGYLKMTYLYKNVDETGEENYKNETIEGSSAQIYLKDDVTPHVDDVLNEEINSWIDYWAVPEDEDKDLDDEDKEYL